MRRYLFCIAAVIAFAGCASADPTAGAAVGFKSHAILKNLTKQEIADLGAKPIWHGQFLLPLKCVSTYCGTFTIQRGFITDGASIPRILWVQMGATDPEIFYPALAHDWIYSLHGILPGRTVTRDQADNMLRELMLSLGCPQWRADAVYRAVHLWGPSSQWGQPTPAYKLRETSYNGNRMAHMAHRP
jgi:hypothetical protein